MFHSNSIHHTTLSNLANITVPKTHVTNVLWNKAQLSNKRPKRKTLCDTSFFFLMSDDIVHETAQLRTIRTHETILRQGTMRTKYKGRDWVVEEALIQDWKSCIRLRLSSYSCCDISLCYSTSTWPGYTHGCPRVSAKSNQGSLTLLKSISLLSPSRAERPANLLVNVALWHNGSSLCRADQIYWDRCPRGT